MTLQWRVLIVDDDLDTHSVTEIVMDGQKVLGRDIVFYHAYSALQADEILAVDRDFAVIILDVVMEISDAGLRLAERIRDSYDMKLCRIILRTGQPGQAPERRVINLYDINDYIAKVSTTSSRLYVSLTSALKSYSQLEQMDRLSKGMSKVLDCTNSMLEANRLDVFAKFLAKHVPLIFGPDTDYAFGYAGKSVRRGTIGLTVFGATPNWRNLLRVVEEESYVLPEADTRIWQVLSRALSSGESFDDGTTMVRYDAIEPTREVVQCFEFKEVPDRATLEIAKALLSSVRVCATRLIMLRDRLYESTVSVGIVAHEFRTPIASMRMNLESLKLSTEGGGPINMNRVSNVVGKTLKIVDTMTDHIDRTMSNVNVVFKDSYLLPVVDVDLEELTREVLDTYQGLFTQVGMPSLNAPKNLIAMADLAMLQKVLLNLLSNSVKAVQRKESPSIKPSINISIDAQDGKAMIKVQDYGVGMTQKELARVFDPFVSTHQEPSHGLGLTMVKKVVSAMGGDVRCESEAGVGTTFFIRLALSV